jgi:hypothetical protein
MSVHTKLREIRIGSWLIAGGWIAAVVGIVVWLTRTPDGELKAELRRWQFWVLEAQFLLLLVLSWINVPVLLRSLELRWRDVRLPIAASALAFTLAAFVAPKTSRIYYDEQIYQGVGQNLTDLHLAQMCNDGNVEYGALTCWSGEYNKEPYAYPYLLSVAYRLTGVHESVAFALNTLFAAALVWVVFLVTAALTSSARAGGYAALVMALVPEQLRWAHTAAVEPSAALACAFAVLTALAFVRLRSTSALLWMVVASIFAVQFRPESLLVAPLVATVCLVYAPEEFRQRRLWWACLIGLLLSAVHVGHFLAVRHEGWGTAGSRLSAAFLAPNLRVNGWFYLGDPRFPVVYSILAMVAVVTWRQGRAIVLCLLYFLLFWGIFLFFYAGSYNFGADDRFSLMTFPPLAMLAGIGAWALTDRRGTTWLLPHSERVVAAALAVQFLWYVPFVRAVGEEAWAARADVAFARSVAHDLPVNSMVLTHNPHMFHLWGRNAAQLSLAIRDRNYAERVLTPRYAGGVFFYWNFWCNVADPVQQSFCTTALSHFPHTLIREYRERDYRYALYRLDLSLAPQSPSQ